ncbi:uncharacterized protein ISCGN_008772 [Ixodes scapularis]
MTSSGQRNENGSSHDSNLQSDEASSGRAVLVACIAITFITGMTLRPLGFYFVNFISHFESAREPVAWAVSLTSASVLFAGVLAKLLLRWFSAWSLIIIGSLCQVTGVFFACVAPNVYMLALSFGFLHGIGAGLVFILCGTLFEERFNENRAVVIRLNVTASCAAGIAFPRLLLFIQQTYGYKGLMLISAGLLLNVPALCFLLRQSRKNDKNHNIPQRSRSEVFTIKPQNSNLIQSNLQCHRKTIFKLPVFYFIAASHLTFFYIINLCTCIMVDTILSKGVPVEYTITVAPAATVFDWIGRIVFPIATEKGYLSRSSLLTIDYFVVGVGLLMIPFAYNYCTVLATCVSFGAFSGHAITVHSSLMAEKIEADQVAISNVIVTSVAAATFLTKPFVIGHFRDNLGSYDGLFYIVGLVTLWNAGAWLIVNCLMRHRKKRTWMTAKPQMRHIKDPVLTNYQSCFFTTMMAE